MCIKSLLIFCMSTSYFQSSFQSIQSHPDSHYGEICLLLGGYIEVNPGPSVVHVLYILHHTICSIRHILGNFNYFTQNFDISWFTETYLYHSCCNDNLIQNGFSQILRKGRHGLSGDVMIFLSDHVRAIRHPGFEPTDEFLIDRKRQAYVWIFNLLSVSST